MPVYLGLDCGGSSCRALVQDASGQTLFQGQGGPANLASTPHGRLEGALRQATRDCPNPDVVCACFAGLLTADDQLRAEHIVQAIFPRAEVHARPDYWAAFYGCEEGTDVCVIAGTGSLVCSKGSNGLVKSGGRGFVLGDQGSAFQYGREALLHYLDAPDSASADLVATIEKVTGEREEAKVLSRVYRGGSPAATLARFAKPFGHDATQGIPYAVEALSKHSRALAQVVDRHIRCHFGNRNEVSLVLAGGLWQIAGIFRDEFMSQLKEFGHGIEYSVQRIKHPPVEGAVRLAKELVNGD